MYLLLRNTENALLSCMTPYCCSGIALEFSFHDISFWSLAADAAVTNSAANLFSAAIKRDLAGSASAVFMLNRCLWPREWGQRPHDDGVCSSQMPQWLCSRSWGQRQDVSQLRCCYHTEARTCFWNSYTKDKTDEEGFFSICWYVIKAGEIYYNFFLSLVTNEVLLVECARIFRMNANKWE